MTGAIAGALAGMGAALALWTAVVFAGGTASCPVPALERIELVVLGLAGLAAVVWAGRRYSPRWAALAWAVFGSLLALVVITVWSMAPWVLAAAVALGGAALLMSRPGSHPLRVALGVAFAAALANFLVLFFLAKDGGIEVVPVPAGSLGARLLPSSDYADAYRARISADSRNDLDRVTRAVLAGLLPCWTRHWATAAQREAWNTAMRAFAFQPGTSVPLIGWKVYARTADEILLGLDQNHLNFRVSILLREENGERWVSVATLVHFNNWRGTAYFLPVRVGHKIIIPQTVRSAVRLLEAPPAAARSASRRR